MLFTVNGTSHEVDVEDDMPLLWVLRDELGITGPKFGCGIAQCGACTVHLDGIAVRACQIPASSLEGTEITTIEGLGTPKVSMPCNRPGSNIRSRNAAIANPARSCRRRTSWT